VVVRLTPSEERGSEKFHERRNPVFEKSKIALAFEKSPTNMQYFAVLKSADVLKGDKCT